MRKLVVIVSLVLLISACGETRDTANTVDEAVKLLQDIEQEGTWEFISDGLDALDEQNYEAAVLLMTDSGEEITLLLQSDSDGELRVQTDAETYFFDGSHLYRIEQERYSCVSDEKHMLSDGARSIFEAYVQAAPGVRLSSITDEPEAETIEGREASRYQLHSKLSEALDVLAEFDNGDLRARVDEAGTFELNGELVLDDDTGALLRFESLYQEKEREAALIFEVKQWDDVADIIPPTEDDISVACE